MNFHICVFSILINGLRTKPSGIPYGQVVELSLTYHLLFQSAMASHIIVSTMIPQSLVLSLGH